MQPRLSPHLLAVLQALLVTFLWSTSWVLIKFGLADIPALTFAGLRYTLAFLFLLPFAARNGRLSRLRAISFRHWLRLAMLGLLYYAVTQGAQFVGLFYLPAVTVSLLLNFTSVIVALLGIFLLGERVAGRQWLGMTLFLAGLLLYFFPIVVPRGQIVGLLVVMLGVLANAFSAVLGRSVNRDGSLSSLEVTVASMGIGSAVLLVAGLLTQGLPQLGLTNWLIVLWLAVVNTAFAFTLWNQTLRTLSAVESSIINGTMLIQIAILAWLFLGETVTIQEIAGMLLVALGALIIQLRPR